MAQETEKASMPKQRRGLQLPTGRDECHLSHLNRNQAFLDLSLKNQSIKIDCPAETAPTTFLATGCDRPAFQKLSPTDGLFDAKTLSLFASG
jgi:hypothetical protein